MSARILSLHIYPIKSCAGIDLPEAVLTRAGLAHDRRWMLVDAEGRFLTQRQLPRMALIRTEFDAVSLRVNAPGMEPLAMPLDGSDLSVASETVGVWSDTILAQSESARAHDWFSRFLGLPCRLLKVDAQARRSASEKDWVERWCAAHPDLAGSFAGDHVFGFADGYPVLVANQASLDALNNRLAAQGKPPVPMDRFRPNIVVQGDDWQAFDEDHTAIVQAGPATLALVKPCTRCPIPNVDQRSGEPGDEPGPTLAALHTLETGVVFGMNAIVAQTAPLVLRAGDSAEISLDF
jgi:uncharacterized protein YcbX